jgi:hypothetical protein
MVKESYVKKMSSCLRVRIIDRCFAMWCPAASLVTQIVRPALTSFGAYIFPSIRVAILYSASHLFLQSLQCSVLYPS